MGNANVSSPTEHHLDVQDLYATDADRLKNHQINTQIAHEQQTRDKQVKILFLGLQDSDRAMTITKIKEFINMQQSQSDEEEQQQQLQQQQNSEFREIIHFHTLNGFQQLLQSISLLDLDVKTLFDPKLSKEEKDKLIEVCISNLLSICY
jgi:hypothetical protein